ncbi:MAG TPA: hypothetical protein VF020_21120 [Chthoniobacterales bacterium]
MLFPDFVCAARLQSEEAPGVRMYLGKARRFERKLNFAQTKAIEHNAGGTALPGM